MAPNKSENGNSIMEGGPFTEPIWQKHPSKRRQSSPIIEGKKLKLDSHQSDVAVEADKKCLQLKTFLIPDEEISGSKQDHELGLALITAWKMDGILQIALNDRQKKICADAMKANMKFVRKPLDHKKKVSQNWNTVICTLELTKDVQILTNVCVYLIKI